MDGLAVIECIRKNGYAFGGTLTRTEKAVALCSTMAQRCAIPCGWGLIMASALDIDDSDNYAYKE